MNAEKSGTPVTEPRCRHCGVEIVLVNYALGSEWRHDPYPHRFGQEYLQCRRTVADPLPETTP